MAFYYVLIILKEIKLTLLTGSPEEADHKERNHTEPEIPETDAKNFPDYLKTSRVFAQPEQPQHADELQRLEESEERFVFRLDDDEKEEGDDGHEIHPVHEPPHEFPFLRG